jgi:dienelactone hydrolase
VKIVDRAIERSGDWAIQEEGRVALAPQIFRRQMKPPQGDRRTISVIWQATSRFLTRAGRGFGMTKVDE